MRYLHEYNRENVNTIQIYINVKTTAPGADKDRQISGQGQIGIRYFGNRTSQPQPSDRNATKHNSAGAPPSGILCGLLIIHSWRKCFTVPL